MNRKSRNKKRRILAAAQPVSMAKFLAEVGKIAKAHGEEFYRVNCELKQIRENMPLEIEFRCYINSVPKGIASFAGATPGEALAALKKAISEQPPAPILPADVLIDLPF